MIVEVKKDCDLILQQKLGNKVQYIKPNHYFLVLLIASKWKIAASLYQKRLSPHYYEVGALDCVPPLEEKPIGLSAILLAH